MKKLFTYLAAVLCVSIVCSCAKDEVPTTGTILGLVSDYTNANAPIAGATVTLSPKGITKTTGSDGRFEFTDIEAGTYSISVSANGYKPTTKQASVYAGQNINCDFQLDWASANVAFSPQTLSFGEDNDQLSFTITNNDSRSFQYTISDYPSYITVSPSSATVAAKGTQTVIVKLDRDKITSNVATTIKVNIESDSYPISINASYLEAIAKMQLTPTALEFGDTYNELQFTVKNIGTGGDLAWNISDPTLECLSVTPQNGVTGVGKSSQVTVVLNRNKMTEDFTSYITVNVNGGSSSVVVTGKYKAGDTPGGNEDPGEEDPEQPEDDVLNGLYAHFTFEGDLENQTDNELTAVGVETSFVTSYNGTQALSIPGKASAMLSIPEGLVDQRKMSISFWVKDLYDGLVFHVVRSYNNSPAFTLAQVDGRLKFVVTNYHHTNTQFGSHPSFTHNKLEGWHMVTLVSDFNETTFGVITTRLYIDGKYTDQVTEEDNPFGESEGMSNQKHYNTGIKFILGGELKASGIPNIPATKLVIDNLRVYKTRMLSAEEVKAIYNKEKQ